MRGFGRLLLLYGAISIVLKLWMPYVYFVFLFWIDNWGSQIGWTIRIGITLAGGALVALSYLKKKPVADGTSQPPPPGRI